MNPDEKTIRFSLLYMLTWIAGFSATIGLFTASLSGGKGWLVGYTAVFLFSLGVFLTVFLIGDPIRRMIRIVRWPMVATALAVCICFAFLVWSINSSIPVFIEQGLTEPGKIAFKKLGVDTDYTIIVKYHVSDPPDCEITRYLLHEQSGHLNYVE